ncbi:hypothetical protein ABEF92_004002 [Exophiala dermatitidis]|uniref:Uncharacterized protein n=1 Tax=Exophiala dermatitidis (strain ATCC 34100 / CBS 525.76 / NIH/UT8656) TaxID=858893 RepID=H6BKN6_EXODN|nr:uncharacterized protein HMPREF1120_00879 [Exophiala dermatitidis NIH/UT8656]EHY52670.1 hypothetical protein HMPREF1120_00879 [Exophiala dermatitidis NIH/UT8656]
MDNQQRAVYLDVPVTDAERARARRRRYEHEDSAALLPDQRNFPSVDEETRSTFRDQSTPVRFPSIHASPAIRRLPDRVAQRFENRQYVPISPIHEEDEPNSINLREPSVPPADSNRHLLYDPGPIARLWTPIWLKQWPLALFALVFAVFIAGLILLWHYDRRNNGFHVARGTSHLAWAYAPTVIVVFVVAAWRMVDYHCKLGMPFDVLQNGPVKASESLLVDYISAFQLVSLFKAFRDSHFAVICSVTGFIMLKVATVFSTCLLVLLPTHITHPGTTVLSNGFSDEAFDPTTPFNSSNFSSSPVYAYYGAKAYGMPFENGVTLDLAYGAITVNSTSHVPDDAVIPGDVDTFVPIMSCHELIVELDTPDIENGTDANSGLTTSSNISLTIPAGGACSQSITFSIAAGDPYTEILPDSQVNGTLQEIYCNSTSDSNSQGPAGLLFTMTDIHYQQTLFDNATDLAGGTFVIATNVSRTLSNMVNVFCKSSYNITKAKVTNDTRLADNTIAVSVVLKKDAVNSTLPRFSAWNATNVLLQSSASAKLLFTDTVHGDGTSDSNAFFTLMAVTHGLQDITSFFDVNKLISAAEGTYKGILSQYAHQTLRTRNNSVVKGGAVVTEESRLRVNDASLWTTTSIFGLLILFCIALIFIAPRAVVPRDPSSIATIAMILTRSRELNRLLRRQGTPSYSNQKAALAGYEFGTAIATTEFGKSTFKIVTSEGEPDGQPIKPNMDFKWWLPFTASIPVVVLTLILPVTTIVALQIVQTSSDRHNGIYTVTNNEWTEAYSHYIPSIVMLVLASLVNMLDFNVALFAPWTNLAKGNATSKRSILNHILGRSPPFAFLQALRTRYLGGITSIAAASLASMLTVVVAGLYYVQDFTVTGPDVSLTQLDTFDLRWANSFTTDNGAAALVDLIMHENFSYPQFTYEELVFPRLSLDNSALPTDPLAKVNGSWTQILPAVRANLRCEVLPESSFNVTTRRTGPDFAYETDRAFVTAQAPLPDSCHLGGYQGNGSFVIYENSFQLLPDSQPTYAGAQLDLLFGVGTTLYGNYGEVRGKYIDDNPPVGCPSLAFTFGRFQLDSSDRGPVTTMVCYQEIQGFNATVTWKPNSTVIDTDRPPVVQNESVFLHDNPISTNGAKSFDFRIQNSLAQELTVFNDDNNEGSTRPTTASYPSLSDPVDIYFQAILNGTDRHDPASLVGKDNRTALLDAINRFYRIYMAQVISINMRTPLNKSSASSRQFQRRQDTGTMTSSSISTTITRSRLVQDRASKLALQTLLGATAVLSCAAWLTTKMRHVLPCNPCSLAGSMSLLAGSDLCYSDDDGLCECCGKPRRRSFGYDDDNNNRNSQSFGGGGVVTERIHAAPHETGGPVTISVYDPSNSNTRNAAYIDEEAEGDGGRRRTQLIPDGAEWMPPKQFAAIFGAGARYSMGWWREQKWRGRRRRFGVDIGPRADGADDQDWELGELRRRRPRSGSSRAAGQAGDGDDDTGFGDFMVLNNNTSRRRGDRDGRGEYSRFSRLRDRSWGRSASPSRSRSRSRSRSGSVTRDTDMEMADRSVVPSQMRGRDASASASADRHGDGTEVPGQFRSTFSARRQNANSIMGGEA